MFVLIHIIDDIPGEGREMEGEYTVPLERKEDTPEEENYLFTIEE